VIWRALPGLLCLYAWAGDPIKEWIAEIEAKGGTVRIARVTYDAAAGTLSIPPDTEGHAEFAAMLRQEEFVRQLVAAQALEATQESKDGPYYLIFLNMDRAADWQGHEDAIIGHELGHAWIKALGYPTLAYSESPSACLAIHTADVVQHILIRGELARRGIDAFPTWIETLDAALTQWKEVPLPEKLTPCDALLTASLWIDVQLGLPAEKWPRRAAFDELLRERYPDMDATVSEIANYLSDRDVTDKAVYREALAFVFRRLREFGAKTANLLKKHQ
jgi:hypothetical protein